MNGLRFGSLPLARAATARQRDQREAPVAMNIHSHDPTADHRQAGRGTLAVLPRARHAIAARQQGVVN